MKCTGIFPWLSKPCNKKEVAFDFNLQLFADGEKTEEPTAKKRADAKKKGQVGKSQELSAAFVLLISFFILKVFWQNIYAEIYNYTVYTYTNILRPIDTETVINIFLGIVMIFLKTAFPVMVAVLLVGLGINFYQVGLNFNTEAIGLKLDKLNPINGFGRIFSKRSLVELVKSLFKIAIIGFFLYNYLKDEIPFMPQYIFLDLTTSLNKMADLIFGMAFQVIAVIIILGVLDYAYQKWQTTQDLKMTKQEVKDENKQSEGDPQIKGKIKQKQRQMAMMRMMQEVPKADVIVTNPTHYAVALMYQKGMSAPVIIAKGQDLVALRIKDIGREHGVIIVENKPLARALYAAAEVGDTVPPELYQAVAEVLAYVYRLKHREHAYA